MEKALRSLRQLSAGIGNEPAVFRAAALVPALGDAGAEVKKRDGEEGSDSESGAEQETQDHGEHREQSELYTWGRATNYQLGYGAGTEQQIPKLVQLPNIRQVTHLSCGRFHSTAVTACGRVFTWGVAGASGRLGLELSKKTEAVVVEPMALPQFGPGRHHAKKVVAGLSHTLALTSAGKLLVWGSNDKGQLGCGQLGENSLQPVVMKAGPFQKLRVQDIAAGAAHSLCVAGEGSVYAWGCNSRGALGLGAPPSGPLQVVQPQSIPHLKAVTSLEASSSGAVSVCLVASHGDAIMFGGSTVAATAGESRSTLDNRFFTPGRVRRKDPEFCELAGPDEWQLQRGTQLSPLQAVLVSDSECLGIDVDGLLWVWPIASRPAMADLAAINLPKQVVRSRLPSAAEAEVGEFMMIETDGLLDGPSSVPPSPIFETERNERPEIEIVGVHAVGCAAKAGTTWAVDDSEARHLWQLKRPSKPDGDWAAERFEYVAQVSCFTCGPEHQAAVVNYTIPHFDGSDEGAAQATAKEPKSSGVPSLQQLCENKLCAKLSPRSFSLVCDVAWELNRPALLDRAFRFLCANAPLMFSRLHLPMLSQLPIEVLAAFEVAARARQPLGALVPPEPASDPCAAPQADYETFMGLGEAFEDRLDDEEALKQIQECCRTGEWSSVASQALSVLAVSLPGTAAGEGPSASRLGLDFSAVEVEDLKVEQKAEADSRKKRKASAAASPAIPQKASPASSKASPKSTAVSPFLQPEKSSPSIEAQDWVEVRNKPPRKGSEQLSSQISPKAKAAESPILVAKGGKKGEAKPAAKASGLPVDEGSSARSLRLSDFIKPAREKGKGKAQPAQPTQAQHGQRVSVPEESAGTGPSPMLVSAVSAVESTKEKRASWAPTSGSSVPLPEIIEEARQAKSKVTGQRNQAKITSSSWGRDTIPSEQPKNQSIHQIQEEEEHIRQQDEIAEIEAMFAALEVAEMQEALEREGISSAESKPKKPGSKASATGQRSEGQSKARSEDRGRKQRGRNARQGSNSDWWSQSWSDASWGGGWWESGKQTHWQKRPVPEDRAVEAEGQA